jgi:hypothetical protein
MSCLFWLVVFDFLTFGDIKVPTKFVDKLGFQKHICPPRLIEATVFGEISNKSLAFKLAILT